MKWTRENRENWVDWALRLAASVPGRERLRFNRRSEGKTFVQNITWLKRRRSERTRGMEKSRSRRRKLTLHRGR